MDALTGMTWSRRPGQILLITGIGELVLAIGFTVAGFFVPEAALGMFLTAGILALVGVPIAWAGVKARARYEAAQALRETGLPGVGQIVGLRQTGVSMNDQPQVEITLSVQIEGRIPYTVTRKEFVPLMLLGTLTSGAPLPLKVNPTNPDDVVIEWERAGGLPATPRGVIGGTNLPTEQALEANRTRLRQVGLDGRASIDRAEDTGVLLGDNHIVLLGITVTRSGSNPYTVSFAGAVPASQMGRCVAGNSVAVKIDPADPKALMIDWDAV
jgi:hypothetical protein